MAIKTTTPRLTAGLLSALILLALPGIAAAQDGPGAPVKRGAELVEVVVPFVFEGNLKSLPLAPEWRPGDPIKEIPRRHFPRPGAVPLKGAPVDQPQVGDPLLELQAMAPRRFSKAFGTLDLDLAGQGFSGVNPPDTVGDVGVDYYIQMINASNGAVYQIYDKVTGAVVAGPTALDTLGSGFCGNGLGDPIVLYDQLAGRWLLSEFSSSGNRMCVYISQTSDPIAGGWFAYDFSASDFPDYPKYAVWPDAYYVGTNENDVAAYAMERDQMLVGAPAGLQRFPAPDLAGFGFQMITPADLDGATPPPVGSPAYFLRHNDDESHGGSTPGVDFLEIFEFSVDWVNPGNSTFTGPTQIPVAEFDSDLCGLTSFSCIAQPGTAVRLDPLREVTMWRNQYRNFGSHQVIVGNYATDVSGADDAGVRWFELRSTGGGWTVFQEGTYAGPAGFDGTSRWMGSTAMDSSGNIAIGYSVSSTSTFPGLRYAGRLASDPAGTLPQGENTLINGTASNASNRYGDYASLNVDPVDECTMWFTGEYIIPDAGGTWATRITSFAFEECFFGFSLSATPAELDVCAVTDPDPVFSVDVTAAGGWSFAVDLEAGREPPGTTSTFAPDNQLPDFTSTYTLLGTGGSTTGRYTIDLTGTGADDPPTQASTQVVLNLAVAAPGAPTLVDPAYGATQVSRSPTFNWTAGSDATAYDLEVATDPGFTDVVYSAAGLVGQSHILPLSLEAFTTYHWRVTAHNLCGSSTSAPSRFTTESLVCRTFASTDVPLPIPQGGGTSGTTVSTLSVGAGDGVTIADVNVLDLAGSHSYVGDLDVFLASPGATSVQLREQACDVSLTFDLAYDDEAAPGPPPCPPTDGLTYQPHSPLSAFDGESSAGTWTLTVVDNFAGDIGQLDTWSLEICEDVFESDIFADGFESGDTTAWSRQVP